MSNKYFPIKTATSCQLKWAWSTIFLNSGVTRSCHRTADSELTPENFFDFHNTPLKLSDRKMMLEGKWPETSCGYCREIEEAGGFSDRMRQHTIPNLTPIEIEIDPEAIVISPSIVEVYFNNTCNLGCLYCDASFSSTIETENRKFGNFESHGINIIPSPNHFKDLVPLFWQWFPEGFLKIKRLHVLGGEPFYQKELDKLLDMAEIRVYERYQVVVKHGIKLKHISDTPLSP
jgi:MoaA/NifB/PqqE/SkfB family radical SAM enzyme